MLMMSKKKATKKQAGKSCYSIANSKIKELEEEIQLIKDAQHNWGVDSAVKHYRKRLIEGATKAELKFRQIASAKGIDLQFQFRINYIKGTRVARVYYADFCDVKNKIVFEIDGEYHNTEEQKRKDAVRTRRLMAMGYKVFRIANKEIEEGKTTAFLYSCYKKCGINIL